MSVSIQQELKVFNETKMQEIRYHLRQLVLVNMHHQQQVNHPSPTESSSKQVVNLWKGLLELLED